MCVCLCVCVHVHIITAHSRRGLRKHWLSPPSGLYSSEVRSLLKLDEAHVFCLDWQTGDPTDLPSPNPSSTGVPRHAGDFDQLLLFVTILHKNFIFSTNNEFGWLPFTFTMEGSHLELRLFIQRKTVAQGNLDSIPFILSELRHLFRFKSLLWMRAVVQLVECLPCPGFFTTTTKRATAAASLWSDCPSLPSFLFSLAV